MLQNFFSFVFDKRFPYYLPYNYLKSLPIKKSLTNQKVKGVRISLTFDVERLPENGLKDPKEFLIKISKILKQKKANSTFFIEGSLIGKFPDSVKIIKKNNEIGLHGFQHELWGNEKWWLNKRSLKKLEKIRLIEKSFEIFEKNNLKKPESFRAPYMISNNETKSILNNFGFKVDSSPSSYLGVKPIPNFQNSLVEIPVSANPLFKINTMFFIPFSYYEIFNMEILKKITKKNFLNFIDNVVNFQVTNNIEPHLVFLAHSWEFSNTEEEKFNYSSPKNYEVLKSFLELLERRYKVKYMTIKKLSKILKGK